MIPFFKNSAFRIWCACLLAFMISLGLIALTGAAGSLAAALITFAVLFAAVYIAVGWLSDQIVKVQLGPLLQEAGILERSGMDLEAEQAFEKALALLDSFLVSPRRRRHYLKVLGARMARFYAAQAENSDRAAKWITRYLHACPGDRAVAEAWLQHIDRLTHRPRSQQDLAARIGDAHRDDRQIQNSLARIYIQSARTDFAALQTYRRIILDHHRDFGPMALDLAGLFIREGRADELALRVYIHAARRHGPSVELRSGLAACLRWVSVSARNRGFVAQARQIIGPAAESELERRSSGFVPPAGRLEPAHEIERPRARLRSGLDRAAQQAGSLGGLLHQQIRRTFMVLKTPRVRAVFKIAVISVLAFGAVALLWDTAGHLVTPPVPPPAPPPETAVKAAPAPYTLQVAAYRKPEHAERYIETLRNKGQDAYRTEAQSQQKIWYQVRIGHFTTKAAARAHAQQLKAAGIIEDYYVANYEGP